jgi:hypothetical protein
MSKRIAIQLFGHLRSFRMTYKSLIKNIVETNKQDGYDIDIFIHTWTETDHSDITWHNPNGKKRGVAMTENIKNEIYTFYKPKKILIEKQLETDDFIVHGKVRKEFLYKIILNLAYTVYKSSELRRAYKDETGIVYDYVIVTRPDILFYKPFRLNSFLSVYEKYNMEVPKNALFVPYCFHNKEYNDNKDVVYDRQFIIDTDLLFFAQEFVIDKATNIYSKLNGKNSSILKDFYCNGFLWYHNWLDEQIEPIRLEYNERICFDIKRTNETILDTITAGGGGGIHIIIRFIRKVIKLLLPYGILELYKLIPKT